MSASFVLNGKAEACQESLCRSGKQIVPCKRDDKSKTSFQDRLRVHSISMFMLRKAICESVCHEDARNSITAISCRQEKASSPPTRSMFE